MLFNKTGRGSEELYDISGIFQAGTDYAAIAAEIDSAMSVVRDLVGEEIVKEAEAAYIDEDATDTMKQLVRAVQLPVAYLAIAMHAKLSGVSHGGTGRKLKVDENEKIPFAWMLDRDDAALRERYFRALDALYRFLDSHDVPVWRESASKALVRRSVIKSLQEFESVYPLEHSNYLFHQLLHPVLEIQDSRLVKIIGADNLARLVDGEQSALRGPSVRFLALRAMIMAVRRWSVDAFPLAVTRRFRPNYQGNDEGGKAETQEIEWYLAGLDKQAQEAALDLQTVLAGDPYRDFSLIPENSPDKKYFTV